jgi:LmbE family N-acetylglucosaminyl deacetylase
MEETALTFVPERAMVVTPHADDLTLFAGGTLACWIQAGCLVHVVRVTQDEKDSLEHTVQETIQRNGEEFEAAMSVLGVHSIVHLGYRDCELLDVSYGEFREHLIRHIRSFRPQVILSFDPADPTDENPDHRVSATAAADAAWAAAYPNFHPGHRDQGLKPHRPLGCYYFSRHFIRGETVVDISQEMDRKVRALLCQRTMMRTQMADQMARMVDAGFHSPALDKFTLDDFESYWEGIVRGAAALAAEGTGLDVAERFRSTLLTVNDPLVVYLLSL